MWTNLRKQKKSNGFFYFDCEKSFTNFRINHSIENRLHWPKDLYINFRVDKIPRKFQQLSCTTNQIQKSLKKNFLSFLFYLFVCLFVCFCSFPFVFFLLFLLFLFLFCFSLFPFFFFFFFFCLVIFSFSLFLLFSLFVLFLFFFSSYLLIYPYLITMNIFSDFSFARFYFGFQMFFIVYRLTIKSFFTLLLTLSQILKYFSSNSSSFIKKYIYLYFHQNLFGMHSFLEALHITI